MSTHRARSALSDRMGFAWEPNELPDMTVDEARKILADDDKAWTEGQMGNEDTGTIEHARLLVQHAGAAP